MRTLILDVDGVICAPEANRAWADTLTARVPFDTIGGTRAHMSMRWSPTVISTLNQLTVPIMLVSSWCEADNIRRHLAPALGLTRDFAVAGIPAEALHPHEDSELWKLDAVAARAVAGTYLWAEDNAIPLDSLAPAGSIHLRPDQQVGLTPAHLQLILEWAGTSKFALPSPHRA